MRHAVIFLLLVVFIYAFAEPPMQNVSVNIQFKHSINLQRTTRQPGALVVDQTAIFVADKTGGINRYDKEGLLLSELTRLDKEFFIAADLAQDGEYLYFIDDLSKSIIKIHKRLDISTAYKIETDNLDLLTPSGIYVDKNQDIYISDSSRDQVFCLNAFGLLEWRRGIFGDSWQSLNAPRALTMYRNFPIVADTGNNAVKQIDEDRMETLISYSGILSLAAQQDRLFIGTLNGIYLYPDKIKLDAPQTGYPEDMFIFDNLLYILDSQQRKILIYEIY